VEEEDDDDAMDLEPDVAPEGDLSVEMVSKLVVPNLIRALEETYDPYSARQTRKLRDVVDFVGMLLGEDHRKYQQLVRVVIGVYATQISTLAMAVAAAAGPMATRAPPYNPAARSAMQRFVRRRIKLLSNLSQWRRLANDVPDLAARVVSLTLRPMLAKTWAEGGGDEMGARVLAAAQGLPPNLAQFLQTGR
jgi:GC-rich sequence DNA-binding factor